MAYAWCPLTASYASIRYAMINTLEEHPYMALWDH